MSDLNDLNPQLRNAIRSAFATARRELAQPLEARRAAFIAETRSSPDSERALTFVASTEAVDRYGDIIRVDGWKTDVYLQNPVFLWAHRASEPPIGKTIALAIEKVPKPALVQTVEFAADDFADRIFRLYKGKFLNAVSVGFRPTKMPEPITDEETGRTTGWEYNGQELLELSAVPIPANSDARIRAVVDGILSVQQAAQIFLGASSTPAELGREVRELQAEVRSLRTEIKSLTARTDPLDEFIQWMES